MRSWARSTTVLLIILLLATIFLAILYRPTDLEPIPEAPWEIVEIAISHAGISPQEIVVSRGTVVVLNITSEEGAHRFGIPGYGLFRDIPEGGNLTLTFLATSHGAYEYKCMVILPEHAAERGMLIVQSES